MKLISLVLASIVSMSLFVLNDARAHGEDKLGPHGGIIRMPGAFHTEIKEKNKSAFELYLLDIEWKNPVVEGSTLLASWTPKGKEAVSLSCRPKEIRFLCELPKGACLAQGDVISVQATRKGAVGAAVTYPYPFRTISMGAAAGGGSGVHGGH